MSEKIEKVYEKSNAILSHSSVANSFNSVFDNLCKKKDLYLKTIISVIN